MRNRKPNLLFLFSAIAVVLGATAEKSGAQVVVYHVEFEKSGSSINFSFFDEALFVADGLGGVGSFIFAFIENGQDFYTRADDSGELFFATKPGKSRAVIRATADNGTAISHYLALGELDQTITTNQRGQLISFRAARNLDGYVLASDTEADEDFSASDGSIGFAGTVVMKVKLDQTRTDAANAANQTVAQTTQALVDGLESRGFQDSEAPIPAPEDGTGTQPTDPANAVQTGEVTEPASE